MTVEDGQVGQSVRVCTDIICGYNGVCHGWATEGRKGVILWLEPDRSDKHIYVVGNFTPPVISESTPHPSWLYHNLFTPWEIDFIEEEEDAY